MDALALRCKWLPHGTRVGGQRPGKDSAPPWSRWPPELGRGTLRLPWALCHWRALMRCCLVSWGSSRAGGRNGVTTIEAISLLISARWTKGINEKYQYFSSAWPCDRRNAKGEWNCSLRSMKETYNSPLGQQLCLAKTVCDRTLFTHQTLHIQRLISTGEIIYAAQLPRKYNYYRWHRQQARFWWWGLGGSLSRTSPPETSTYRPPSTTRCPSPTPSWSWKEQRTRWNYFWKEPFLNLTSGYHSHNEWPKKIERLDWTNDGHPCRKVHYITNFIETWEIWHEWNKTGNGNTFYTYGERGLDIDCNAGSRKWSAILTPRLWFSLAPIPTTVLGWTYLQPSSPCTLKSSMTWSTQGVWESSIKICVCNRFVPPAIEQCLTNSWTAPSP